MRVALYLRVSTSDQTTDNQQRELADVARLRGWEIVEIFQDAAVSGAKRAADRPALANLLKQAKQGRFDMVAAWSVDRLGRSLSDLLETADELRALGIQLYLHKQAVDTTTPTGRLTYQVLGAVAEWEREMIRERVDAGIARAKAAGTQFGRKRVHTDENKIAKILALKAAGKSLRTISELTLVPMTSVGRIIKRTGGWLE